MTDQDKSKQKLIEELAGMRRRVAALEKALQDNQSATTLLHIAPLGIHELDAKGRITFVNPSQESITGYTADELVGTYVWDRIEPGPERDSLPVYLEHLVSEQPAPTPFFAKNIRKNGDVFDVRVDWNYKRNPQGQVTGFVCILSDVTERKRAEVALRESEERFRQVFEAGPMGILLVGTNGRIQHVNRRFREMLGYSENEIIALGLPGISHPDDWERDHRFVSRLWHGEISYYHAERRYFHKDGHVVWGRLTVSLLHDEAGSPMNTVGMVEDITEHKRADEALVESESQLLEAQEVASLGFYVCDLATGRFTTSAVLDRIFGVPADYERSVGGWANLLHPDDRQEMLDGFKKAVDEKKPNELEYRIVRYGDKQVRWVHGLGRLQFNEDGQPISMLGTIQDITERKRAEEALLESEERFRLLVEAIPQPIWRSDPDGNVMEFNRRWHEYTGQTAEEAKASGWTKALHPDEAAMVVQAVRASMTSGASFEIVNRLRRASDGSYRWHLARAVPMSDRGGKIVGWFGCATDIDDQKRAEEALRQSEEALQKAHADLERRVKERTAELAKANENLDIFRRFAETSGQGFSMADLDGRLLYLNPALCRMLDVERPEDCIGQHLSICYSEESNRRGKQEIEPALMQDGHWQGELPLLSRQGKSIPTWHSAFLIRDESGKPVRMAVVITDITERKQAENRLAYLASFPERNPHPIVEVSLGGDIGYMNAAAQRLVPELHEQGLKHPWLGNWEAVLRQFGEGRAETAIHEVALADRWYQQAFCYLAQDQVVRIYGLDITDRKRAEEALRRSEERLRLAQQVARVGTFEWNVQTGLNTWTPELEAMYGLFPGSFPGTQPAWENLLHCDDRAEAIRLVERTLETGEPVEGEWRVVWPDGIVRWLSGRWQAFKDESGKPLRMIGVNIDITDRKRAEEALQRQHKTLQHLLQSSDHERQVIAYEIHDGLAQQLAGAIMQLQAYDHLKDSKPKLAAKAYDAGLTMLQQGHFETRRLIAGVRPPILDEEGITAAVGHLVNEQIRLKGPKIDFHSRVDFDRLDPTLENAIYRIAQEALTNACKHGKSERISVSLLQRGDRVRIEIRDWGVGFDPKTIPKSHFGLEGIRQRARLLGGKCSIRSTKGKGTRVTVELPVVPRDEEE